MTAELFEYVRIGQNNEGYALVEVCMKDAMSSVNVYLEVIKQLNKTVKVAYPQNKVETTNANKDRVAMVTVKGDAGLNPTETFIEEKKKVV